MNASTTTPNFATMTNEQIGTHVHNLSRKLAGDVYQIAKGIEETHNRLHKIRGAFWQWCRAYIPHLSRTTVYRYLRVALLKPEDIGNDESITQVYVRLGMKKYQDDWRAEDKPEENKDESQKDDPTDEVRSSVPTDPTRQQDMEAQDDEKRDREEQDEDQQEMELQLAKIYLGDVAKEIGITASPEQLIMLLAKFDVPVSRIASRVELKKVA